jgi:hypothetical protein
MCIALQSLRVSVRGWFGGTGGEMDLHTLEIPAVPAQRRETLRCFIQRGLK